MRYLLILLLPLNLSSCSLFDERIVVEKEPVYFDIICPVLPGPAPIAPRKVRPQVVEDKVGVFWVGLTPSDYENLAINTQEAIRYIKGSRSLTRYYRNCIDDFNRHLKELEE